MESTNINSDSIEAARELLNQKHILGFIDTLENAEDPSAERSQLISLISQSINRLLEVEQAFVKDTLEEEDICLHCFARNTRDWAALNAVAASFNHYLKESSEE